MDEQFIVICGTLGSGFTAYGPFDDYNKAMAFGEDSNADWHVMELHAAPQRGEVDITEEGAPILLSMHSSIFRDEDGDYMLFCPNIDKAVKSGRTGEDVLRSIKGSE